MNEVSDFENKLDYEKTLKLVKRFKRVKRKDTDKPLKVTGKITQVIKPNEFIIKTKSGKYFPVVVENGTVNAIFDYYDRTLIIVKDSYGDEHTLDYKYDVTVMLGMAKDFTMKGEIYEAVGYDLISFFGLER